MYDAKAKLQHFLRRRLPGMRRSDARVRAAIYSALFEHPGVDASEIQVLVSGGAVTLRGTVPNRWMIVAAESAIAHVSGVESIQNEISIASSDRAA